MKEPRTIMLIDDDEDDQMIFLSAINEINTTIECACYENAENSWRILQETTTSRPDCIFLDLNLPFMHGFEFLKMIKTSSALNDIPVIIYSTSSREADKVKARELGAFDFFSKPSSFHELKDGINHLLTGVGKDLPA